VRVSEVVRSLDEEAYFRRRFRTWGLRFYACAFVGFGFLVLARAARHIEILRIAAKALAVGVGAAAITMGIVSYGCAIRYRRAGRRARRARL
jgi:hypothetical protein